MKPFCIEPDFNIRALLRDLSLSSDPYVKIYLLYNGQRISKKKTHVKKRH